jgi:ABC-type uncharacterized transport system permease subunit
VTIWTASLVSATAVAAAFGDAGRTPSGSAVVFGALAGGVVALLPALLTARRRAGEGGGIKAQLP